MGWSFREMMQGPIDPPLRRPLGAGPYTDPARGDPFQDVPFQEDHQGKGQECWILPFVMLSKCWKKKFSVRKFMREKMNNLRFNHHLFICRLSFLCYNKKCSKFACVQVLQGIYFFFFQIWTKAYNWGGVIFNFPVCMARNWPEFPMVVNVCWLWDIWTSGYLLGSLLKTRGFVGGLLSEYLNSL